MTSFRQRLSYLIATPARLFAVVLLVYLASSFFSATVRPLVPLPGDLSLRYRNNYWAVISMPRVLRGDEMHYLMMAHSLAGDGDLLLSDDYNSVQNAGPEMGLYHRNRAAANFLQHFSRNENFTLLGNHPWGLSALLAMLLWPLAGTFWMEPAAIWLTAFWGAMGVLVFLRLLLVLDVSWTRSRNAALLMAFATPWWSYSRTLYTEVYIGTAMLIVMYAVLANRTLLALPFCVAMGWFKYPAMALFFGAGAGEALWRRLRNFLISGITGVAVLTAVYLFNRHYFEGASWITRDAELQESRARWLARAGAPIAWIPGRVTDNIERLFLDFDKGLFPHCPLLFVALAGLVVLFRREHRLFWLAVVTAGPWTLVHITYEYLMSGASYTTRYLVPVVPVALVGLPWFWQWSEGRRRWRMAAMALTALSLLNNILAGILPATSFDRKPWEIVVEWGAIVRALILGEAG